MWFRNELSSLAEVSLYSYERWWNDADGKNRSTLRKTCPIATWSTYSTRVGLGSEPGPAHWEAGDGPTARAVAQKWSVMKFLLCSFPCTDGTASYKRTDQCTPILLYERCVTPCFVLQKAVFRQYSWYIFAARSTEWVPDVKFSLLSSVCYVTQ